MRSGFPVPGSVPMVIRASHVPSALCRMLPAPCAALVFDFLGIEIPPIFVYDGRAVGVQSLLPPIAVPGVTAPGAVFYFSTAEHSISIPVTRSAPSKASRHAFAAFAKFC